MATVVGVQLSVGEQRQAARNQAIEKMYPDFDAQTRLELFARGDIKGWTTYGFEAD